MINQSPPERLKLIVRQMRQTSGVTLITVLVFCAFFQMSKEIPLLRAVNSFLEDPYDLVGSIAVQIALFVALLTLMRAFGHPQAETVSFYKLRFIIRGNAIALAVVAITLSTDLLAEYQQAALWPTSRGEIVLNGALWGISALTLAAGLKFAWLVKSAGSVGYLPADAAATGADNTIPDDVFQELLAFIQTMAAGLIHQYPRLTPLLRWPEGQAITATVHSVGSYFWAHPWRVCLALALTAGAIITLIQVVGEGVAADPATVVMVSLIFVGTETLIVVVSYALLGGFLGLRRPVKMSRPPAPVK